MAQSIAETAPHQAIYRRFRAQTFAQIVGQNSVVQTLRNAVRLGRLSHGFLFVGPRGTGKTSTARILAKAVNCMALVDGEPDDTCVNCVSIREGRALDVIELDAASNNRVDDMRELLPRVYTSASDLKHKVFIIDEVQRIKEGWDVLLKTLEEPPQGVLFIFCTTDPSQIRPAVVSRLQRFTFRPLSTSDIEGKLSRILEAEGRSAEPDALALVAQLAAGGMRDAESMLDQVLANADDPISASTIRDLIGLAEAESVHRFIDALTDGDALGGITVLDQLEAEGRDVVAFAEQVVVGLRQNLIEGMGAGESARVVSLSAAARRLTGIDASRSGLGGYRWQLELALLSAAAGRNGTAAVTRGVAPAAQAVSATESTRRVAAPEVVERHELADTASSSDPAATPSYPHSGNPSQAELSHADASPASPRPSANGAPSVDTGDLIDRIRREWPAIVARISRSPANKPLVSACRPVEIREGVLVLGFPEHQAFLREKAEARRSQFEEALEHVLGRPIGVRCIVANLDTLQPLAIESADLVEQARRVFGGDLAEVNDIS